MCRDMKRETHHNNSKRSISRASCNRKIDSSINSLATKYVLRKPKYYSSQHVELWDIIILVFGEIDLGNAINNGISEYMRTVIMESQTSVGNDVGNR
eukprot:scaffold1189_cov194-Amphora_coffeaeformis.AAC.17